MIMPGVVRLADNSRGHGCFPPKPNIQASTDIFTNGRGVVRVGDIWAVHKCRKKSHGSVSTQGSPNVFANGQAVVRQFDALSCADAAQECSSDVLIN